MVDEMLFELLGQFSAKYFKVLLLLGDLGAYLHNFLINIARQEMSTFSRFMGCILNILENFSYCSFLLFFNRGNFIHYIFE